MRGRGQLRELPVFQCYDCHSCGRCCHGWFEVPVTAAERERILALGYSELLGLPPEALFAPRGDAWRLRHLPDGACVFLHNNRCRIHADHGAEAKPLACRIYPFHFVPAGDGVRVEVRFDCPSVAGNRGRTLADQELELAALAAQQAGGSTGAPSPPALSPGEPGTWPLARRVVAAALELLLEPDRELLARLLALRRLALRLESAPLQSLAAEEADRVLRAVTVRAREESAALATMPPPTPPGGVTRYLFRQLLASYGRADRVDAPPRPARRLATAVKMLAGSGPIPFLRDDLPPAMFAATDDVTGLIQPASEALLTRYLRLRLHSGGFCGAACWGFALTDGLSALLLTIPLIGWYARLLAAAEQRETCSLDDVERAVGIVDGAHGRSPLLAMPSEQRKIAYLSEPGPLLVLTRWYGR